MDMRETIVPKSDQLNADDLMAGPVTVTITETKPTGNSDQPVAVHLAEFPGRPFKPCKTVRRILVAAWGPESDAYTGQRMTLICDPAVKWGGQLVGGIRVSHMSGMGKTLKIALTTTQGKKALFTIAQLATPAPPDPGDVWAVLTAAGCPPDRQLDYVTETIGRQAGEGEALTDNEVAQVRARLNA